MTDTEDMGRLMHTTAEVFWMEEGGMQRPIRDWSMVTPLERQYWERLAAAILTRFEVRRK